jgi:hypothetical protein
MAFARNRLPTGIWSAATARRTALHNERSQANPHYEIVGQNVAPTRFVPGAVVLLIWRRWGIRRGSDGGDR